MKFHKSSFKKSFSKIFVTLFLIGYNFAPSVLAIEQLNNIDTDNSNQSVVATTEEASEKTVDTSEDIIENGGVKTSVYEETKVMKSSAPQSKGAKGETTFSASSSGKWTSVNDSGILVAGTLNTNWIKWDRWGSQYSGLEFIGKPTFSINGEQEFELGTLQHHNYPVNYAIEKATLSVTINLGAPISQTKVFNMNLQIEETPNSGTCPSWHTPGNPECDDRITFPTVYSKGFFEIDGVKYVLEITGFIKDGQNVTSFITKERETNQAVIRGRLRSIPANVTICHASESHTNQYVEHSPSAGGSVGGHSGHNGPIWYPGITEAWGDIIPEFRYFDENGNVKVYPGKNNTEYGLSILANGCVFPQGKITVNKVVIPAGDPTSFTITGTGVPAVADSPTTFLGSNTGTISGTTSATFDVYPGKYTFVETAKEGWIETANTCNNVTVEKCNDKKCTNAATCTITNTQASTLTIVKHAEQVSDTQFNFTTTGNGLYNFSLVDNDANNDPKKVFTNLLPGEYSVTEDTKDGWDLQSAVCDNEQTPDALNLTAGSNVTCTFTNTQRGSLTIVKNAIPSSNQVFSFTTTGTGLSAFTLVDNSDTNNPSKVFKNLLPGTYSVSETVPSNWYLDSATCSDGSPITAIDLSAGEDITCTFNNIKYGSISGHKYHDLDGLASTINDRKPVYGYTIFIDTNKDGKLNPDEKLTTTAIDGSYSFTGLEPGEYTIAEVMKIGWIVLPSTVTSWTIELSAGVDKEDVDFINIEKPTIAVIKFVDTDGDGEVDERYVTDWTWKLDDKEYKMFGKEEKPMEIIPGTYTISEIQKDGYHVKSMMCDNGGVKIFEKAIESAKLTINSGDKILCRFTNTRDTGTLIVRKEVVNDNGGKLVAEDFSFEVNNGAAATFNQSTANPLFGENTITKVPTGSYSIVEVEADQRGYATKYSNDCNGQLNKGDIKTCVITNNDNAPKLELVKTVTNDNGGTAVASNWNLKAEGPTSIDGDGGVTSGDDFKAGTYTLSESGTVNGYSAGDWSCTNNITVNENNQITLGLGESTVCTIVNDDIAPSLQLVKVVENDFGGNAETTDWILTATGTLTEATNLSGKGSATSGTGFKVDTYTLSETSDVTGYEASSWSCTNDIVVSEGDQITLGLGQSTVCTITNTALPATINVSKDVVYGEKDINTDDSFTVHLQTTGEESQTIREGIISDSKVDSLIATFENLSRGTYKIEEISIPDGYIAKGCKVKEDEELRMFSSIDTETFEVTNGQTVYIVCTNDVIEPILEIEKSNNAPDPKLAGDEVIYTLKVTAPSDDQEGTYILNNVILSDIAPAGFGYILGTWTSTKDGVPEPTYDGKTPAEWKLGSMKEGDVITLTYRVKIATLQEPGIYPDIAWVKGTALSDDIVLGNQYPVNPYFVGTDVEVVEDIEVEEGEVLGASITLPATGASTYLTLGALIMMILTAFSILVRPFKKLKYVLLLGTLVVSLVNIYTPNRVFALSSDIQVKITQPSTPTNKSSFDVGFVALDLNNNTLTIECYENDSLFATFTDASAGKCPAKVSTSGIYEYYVKAKSASGEQTSPKVFVRVELGKPSPVTEYSKVGNIIKFKTANDGKTKKVEIHRSEKSSYTANESTRVHLMDVSPNTEYTWTDTSVVEGKTYYYALRTIDDAGNVSTFVSDSAVVVTTAPTTGTTTTVTETEGDVAGQTDSEADEEVAGESDSPLEGDIEKEDGDNGDEDIEKEESTKTLLEKWYIWVPAILLVLGVGYIYVKRNKKE